MDLTEIQCTVWDSLSSHKKESYYEPLCQFSGQNLYGIWWLSVSSLGCICIHAFMRENTAEMVPEAPNPKSKHSCWDAHMTSFPQSRMDGRNFPGNRTVVCLGENSCSEPIRTSRWGNHRNTGLEGLHSLETIPNPHENPVKYYHPYFSEEETVVPKSYLTTNWTQSTSSMCGQTTRR